MGVHTATTNPKTDVAAGGGWPVSLHSPPLLRPPCPAPAPLPLPPSAAGDRERTSQDVHATLCALVITEAAKHEAWADYAAVLLDEETAAFFAARLPEAKATKAAGGESGSPPSKKRKKQADSGEANTARDDAADDITLRVACLDGSSLELTVPPRELVREVKRLIGQVRG